MNLLPEPVIQAIAIGITFSDLWFFAGESIFSGGPGGDTVAADLDSRFLDNSFPGPEW
jgi:hypothetical protein